MAKKSNKDESRQDARYTTRVAMRLMPEEHAILQGLADELHCTLSHALRIVLLQNGSRSLRSEGDAQVAKRMKTDLSAVRSDFKRIAQSHAAFVESYRQVLLRSEAESRNLELTQAAVRSMRSMQDMLLELQSSVNELLRGGGVKETHAAAPLPMPDAPASPAVADGKPEPARCGVRMSEREIILYFYMERIEIIGVLEKDARTYERGGGVKMAFTVVCLRSRKEGPVKTTYSVFAERSAILDQLKDGRSVYVAGRFDEGSAGKAIYADVVKVLDVAE